MTSPDIRPAARSERVARWMYSGIWAVLVQWFHVPDDPPTLPAHPQEIVHSFRPAVGFLRYLKLGFWIALVVIDVAIMFVWLMLTIAVPWLGALLLPVALFVAIVPDVIAYIAIHLRYDTTWYVISDRSLRLRRGIWVIHEVTITYENIQNVRVRQGPLQRYFGIADVVVETAGGGGASGHEGHKTTRPLHQGLIEGIDNASELRDRILARLKKSRSAGLGDEHHKAAQVLHRQGGTVWTGAQLAALREIRLLIGAIAER